MKISTQTILILNSKLRINGGSSRTVKILLEHRRNKLRNRLKKKGISPLSKYS